MKIPFRRLRLSVTTIALMACLQTLAVAQTDSKVPVTDQWAPFRPLIGKWRGTADSPTGKLTQTTEWKFVLDGKFLQCTTSARGEAEHHQDIGLVSYDSSRKKFVYRGFHSEGFVNRYVGAISPDRRTIVFETEAIENGPPGLKAMETFELKGDALETTLKLAFGDKPFQVCARALLNRDAP